MDYEDKITTVLEQIGEDSPPLAAIRRRVMAATDTSRTAGRWQLPVLVAAAVGIITVVIAIAATTTTSSGEGQAASQPRSAVPRSFTPVFCYATVDLDATDNWMSVMSVSRSGDPSTVIADYVDLCRESWKSGELNSTHPHVVPDPKAQPPRPVPPLTACVRADGKLAIFPGTEDETCQQLGLPRAVDR